MLKGSDAPNEFALTWIQACGSTRLKWCINSQTKVISSPPLVTCWACVIGLQWIAPYDKISIHTLLTLSHFLSSSSIWRSQANAVASSSAENSFLSWGSENIKSGSSMIFSQANFSALGFKLFFRKNSFAASRLSRKKSNNQTMNLKTNKNFFFVFFFIKNK